jgi:hypothetical protein
MQWVACDAGWRTHKSSSSAAIEAAHSVEGKVHATGEGAHSRHHGLRLRLLLSEVQSLPGIDGFFALRSFLPRAPFVNLELWHAPCTEKFTGAEKPCSAINPKPN